MHVSRRISRVVTVPPVGPGFAGPAHTAAEIISPDDFEATDPFFLMMDDHISVAGPVGSEHPHAGLETVSFMLEGTSGDLGGNISEGDVEWMTAGGGIVHAEEAVASAGMRLLQLWVALPEDQRNIAPRVQILRRDDMPVRREPGVEARIYSGRSGGLEAGTLNAVPVTLLDIRLQAGASFEQEIPSSNNGFLLVLAGEVAAGNPSVSVAAGHVGWLDHVSQAGSSVLSIGSGAKPSRALFYAGERQNINLASRGPFIAGSETDLAQLFARYRRGEFPRASSMRVHADQH